MQKIYSESEKGREKKERKGARKRKRAIAKIKSKNWLRRKHQIKILYILATYLPEIYCFGEK